MHLASVGKRTRILLAASATVWAAGAALAFGDTLLFSTAADFGGSSFAPNPPPVGQPRQTGWGGWGYYDGAGTTYTGTDSQGNPIVYSGQSTDSATANGLGNFANDFAASPPDPNLGKSWAGLSSPSGSMTIQGYEGQSEGEGYDVVDTGEMVFNSTASSAFIHALGTGTTMAIDFTAPGGGTTLTSDGKNAIPYYLLALGTYDSHGGLDTNGAGAGWVNATTNMSSKDAGSNGDDPGSFVVMHGSGASSYWTAYIPYSYTAALSVSYLQMFVALNSDGYSSGANGNVTIDNIRTVSPTWAASGSGLSWNQGAVLVGGIETTQGNWVGAGANGLGTPNGSGVSVTFGDLETGNATVGLDTNQTVGTLIINSTGDNSSGVPIQYNLAAADSGVGAGGSLIMDNTVNSAPAAINFIAGASIEYITAPVVLNSSTVVTVTSAANTLFFGSDRSGTVGGISGAGSLTVGGAGTVELVFANTYSGGTTVNAGGTLTAVADNALPSEHALVNNGTTNIQGNATLSSLSGTGTLNISPLDNPDPIVTLAMNSGLATQGGLTIAANSSLDITNNHLIIGYTSATKATVDANIRSYIISGRNGGTWTGTTGITSSVAALPANSHYAIGYADGADGVVSGLSSGQIEIKYTLLGDADLAGSVTGNDFTILVSHLGKLVTRWDQGDFDYDGSVTGNDFTALVSNIGKSATGADVVLPAADYAAIDAFAAANGLMADVPEPASAGLLLVAGFGMLARRRRAALAI
jgi:autotransporter-associated beta strand protein